MKATTLLVAVLVLLAPVHAKSKVAILNAQRAVLATEDGKSAAAELHRKFDPTQQKLAAEQREIEKLKGQKTAPITDQIVAPEQAHRRHMEDARQSFEVEQKRILKDLTAKLFEVVDKYAKQKHLEVVLDESDPKTPIFWSAKGTDITEEVIKQYELAAKKR